MERRIIIRALACAGVLLSACSASPEQRRAVPVKARSAPAKEPLAVTSKERWRVALPSTVVGIPLVEPDAVFVSTEQSLVAVRHDGSVAWSTPFDMPRVFAPVAEGDLVFVAGEHWLAAVQRSTGQPVWQFDAGAGEGARLNRPAPVGDVVVAVTDGGRVLGFERATGVVRWEAALSAGSGAQIAVRDGIAIVVGIAEWAAFDAATGANLWSGELGFIGTSSPAIADTAAGPIAVVASENRLIAAGLRDGQIRWTGHAEQSEHAQVPVMHDDQLLVPDHWGRLTAYDPTDGRVLWKTAGSDGVAQWGAPVVLGRRLVAMALSEDGPRIASPQGALALRPPSQGWGVARLPDGGLVVSTYGDAQNYLVTYDLDVGSSARTR